MKKFLVVTALMLAPLTTFAQDKTWNIQFSPVAFLVGILNVDVDYALNSNWTVGPQGLTMSYKYNDIKVSGSSFGAHARYYFDKVYSDGWYGSGQIGSFSLKVEDESNGDHAEASGMAYSLGGGYHWFWETFNLRLGLVGGSTSVGKIEIKDAGGNVTDTYTPSFNTGIDFAIGFAF